MISMDLPWWERSLRRPAGCASSPYPPAAPSRRGRWCCCRERVILQSLILYYEYLPYREFNWLTRFPLRSNPSPTDLISSSARLKPRPPSPPLFRHCAARPIPPFLGTALRAPFHPFWRELPAVVVVLAWVGGTANCRMASQSPLLFSRWPPDIRYVISPPPPVFPGINPLTKWNVRGGRLLETRKWGGGGGGLACLIPFTKHHTYSLLSRGFSHYLESRWRHSKSSKKTLDFYRYCFVTSLWLFIFEEWDKCTFKK